MGGPLEDDDEEAVGEDALGRGFCLAIVNSSSESEEISTISDEETGIRVAGVDIRSGLDGCKAPDYAF
jgi:hypothetical protein